MEWLHSSLFDLGLCFGRMRKRPHSLERRLQGRKGGRERGEDQEAKVIILMAVVGTGRRRRAEGVGGDASEGEGEGGIKVGESERKKGRVRSVWRPTGAAVRMTLVKIMALSLSLLRPRWTSLPFRQASFLPIIFRLLKRPFRLFKN